LFEAELTEHTEPIAPTIDGEVLTFAPTSISLNVRDFMRDITLIGALRSFTDHHAGPTEI
jgi:hypothetical protein